MALAVKRMATSSQSHFSRFFSSNSVLRMPARPLVLCGPSGVGKSTLVDRLKKEFPDAFGFSVSHTTRKPREGEVDGISYHYVDQETIEKAIENDEFIEHATFSGNTYGTSKSAVQTVVEQGKICILDIVSLVVNIRTTHFGVRTALRTVRTF